MKSGFILMIFSTVILASSATEEMKSTHNSTILNRIARQTSVPLLPNKTCDNSTEDDTYFNSTNPNVVWICKSSQWTPYQLSVSVGSSKQFSGQSCKHIRDVSTNDCLPSKVYWVQEMEIYCEMDLDWNGGGWTLVWQHSYMEDLPLTTNMTFYSNYYKACNQHATGWCNVPNKARFNPTEQIIVAYTNKGVIYAYKGLFNRNIDYDWTGGYLIVYTKVFDNCQYYKNVPPSPVQSLPGIAFSKYSSACNYYGTGGTIAGTLTSPRNDRWRYCLHRYNAINSQMTLAIYVR